MLASTSYWEAPVASRSSVKGHSFSLFKHTSDLLIQDENAKNAVLLQTLLLLFKGKRFRRSHVVVLQADMWQESSASELW